MKAKLSDEEQHQSEMQGEAEAAQDQSDMHDQEYESEAQESSPTSIGVEDDIESMRRDEEESQGEEDWDHKDVAEDDQTQ